MEIELMRQERMGVEGKGILRSLQNDTLPIIDLLIREALQNSLDAAKQGAKEIYVNIGICGFEVELLAQELTGITEYLINNYSNKTPKAIYISDKNTIGLTGNVKRKEGNIYDLIYTVQRNQEQAGAGGSWGLGKTSFFRVGNGIVLYYSRVKIGENQYEERLAGSLIEDSTKIDRILDNNRGIAWWGEKEKKDYDNFDSTYPLTDSTQIHTILDIFKIKPYSNDETGTTIIIPFIDEDRLLPKNEDEGRKPLWWESNLEDAIAISIQKWYAPRIFNLYYDGAYLVPSVNNKVLKPNDFQPFFRKIHELYLCGLRKEGSDKINMDTIELKNRGISSESGVAGWLAHGLFSKEDLEMTPPNNEIHPLEYFGYTSLEELEKTNAKIVAYGRKPGMIIEYDINGNWSKTISPSDNEFLLSFFLPNSKGRLYDKFIEPDVVTLEDYLRKTEKSDHAEWEDITLNNTKVTIVNRIMRNVSRVMQQKYNELENNKIHSKASILGRKIGDKLLPKHGISGKTPVKTGEQIKIGKGKRKGKRNTSIDVLSVDVNEMSYLEVDFILNIGVKLNVDVSVNLRTGTKNYNEENWIKDMGKDAVYPFLIKEIFIKSIDNEDIELNVDNLKNDRVSIYFTSFACTSLFRVENNSEDNSLELEGKLVIEVYDVLMQPSLVVSEVKENV